MSRYTIVFDLILVSISIIWKRTIPCTEANRVSTSPYKRRGTEVSILADSKEHPETASGSVAVNLDCIQIHDPKSVD